MTDTSRTGSGPSDEGAPFWDAAAAGRLLLKRCVDTGRVFFYPRERSPFTAGRTERVESRGEGEIHSCSVSHRADPPYCIAHVRLDKGPTILTNALGRRPVAGQDRRARAGGVPSGRAGRATPFVVLVDGPGWEA